MDADLLTVARRLAEGGHLPGVDVSHNRLGTDGEPLVFSNADPRLLQATEADLHLAAHNAIVAKGWNVMVVSKHDTTTIYDWKLKHDSFELDWEWSIEKPGTTTMSLLTAFAAALEAK